MRTRRSHLAARPPRHIGFWIFIVAFSCLAGLATAGAVATFRSASRSTFVQHHGLRTTGHVTGKKTKNVGGANTRSVASTLRVALAPPVRGGVTATSVHVNGPTDVTVGDDVAVLVDPDDTAYAELPGVPTASPITWRMNVGFAAALLAILGFVVISRRRTLRSGNTTDQAADPT